MKIPRIAGLLWLIFAGLASMSWGQAVVNESLETAHLYVDPVAGNDDNPGTAAAPFKTINAALTKAITNNHNNVGTKITANPGLYRESISLGLGSRDTSSPITVEAAQMGTAIISGAVQYSNWQTDSTNSAVYTTGWSARWGECALLAGAPPAQDIVMRREMVFVNGAPMTQVMSHRQLTHSGSFYVDENAGLLYIWPPSGTSIHTADVEVATEPSLLNIYGKNSMVFRGIAFQYAANCRDSGAVTVAGPSSNILFDSDVFSWNNSSGFYVIDSVSNFTVQNSIANHNGQSGFKGTMTKFGLWQNDVAAYNNWRGAQGASYVWNTSGAHFWAVHSDTVRGMTLAYNQTHGIHWDTDNTNISTSGLKAVNNLGNGLMLEVDPGPISFDSAVACNNGPVPHDQSAYQGGLLIRNSQNVSLTNSTMFNNTAAEINIQGTPGGIPVTDWETGTSYNLISQGVTLNHDVFDSQSTELSFSDSYLGGSDWTAFSGSFNSSSNTWWNPTQSASFRTPAPVYGTYTMSGWNQLTGQDLNSSWAQPPDPTPACAYAADAPDYWVIAANEQTSLTLANQGSNTLSLVPIGGFNGPVSFSADVPSNQGISVSLSPASLTGSGSVTMSVASSNSTPAGSYPVTLLASNGNTLHAVTVSVIVPASKVRLSTTTLDFGSQTIGSTSAGKSVTVTNIGTSTLSISSIAASPAFGVSSTCGTSLQAGASCTVTATFSPSNTQAMVGTITLTDSDLSGPQIIALTGTGAPKPTVTLLPTSLSFGSVRVGSKSAPMTVKLTNTSTTSALIISSVSLTGNNTADFSQTNTCGKTLSVGQSCNFTVTFQPGGKGGRAAKLISTENSGMGTHTSLLSGSGS